MFYLPFHYVMQYNASYILMIFMHKSLKEVREELGISTSELAIRLGKSQSTVVRLEKSEAKGTISLQSLRNIANALDCQIKILYRVSRAKKIKKYPGMKRSTMGSKARSSLIAESMRKDEEKLSRLLTEEERIFQCLSLSEFARNLH